MIEAKAKKNSSRCSGVKEVDQFYETVHLKFDKGTQNFKTGMGAFMTILMLFVILAYAMDRLIIMFKIQKHTLQEHVEYGYYAEEYNLGADLGIFFAFGISNYP